MAAGRYRGRSDLFLVRVWVEEAENGQMEWYGKVQRATSGERSHFRSWTGLAEALLELCDRKGKEKSTCIPARDENAEN